MVEPGRQDRVVGLAVAIVAAVATLWPVLPGVDVVVGDPLGETDNHLWMLWRAARGGGVVGNLPVGVDLPLMDPVNLPPYALGALVGPAVGWALLRAWNVGLAMAGGYALARCFAPARAAWVGMVALGVTPFLAGVMDFGITESWPLGWLALHAALLVQHARHGGRGKALAAGVALGMVALSGWYHAFFGLVLEAMLVPALLWRHRRPGTVLQGLAALGMALPSFVDLLARADQWSPRWRPPSPGPPGPRADWAELPVYGTDLLTFLLPHPDAVHPSKSVYVGGVVVLLAAWGLVRRPRVAGPLLALAGPFFLLALGYWPTVAGKALGFPGLPWLVVEVAPPMNGLSHWHRAVAGGLPFVAAAAAVGAAALSEKRVWILLFCGLVTADAVGFGGTAWPRSTTPLDAPASLRELPGAGGVVQLPFDNGRVPFSAEPARIYQRWQVVHERSIAENYEGQDAVLVRSRLVAAADARCLVSSTLPPYYQPPPEMRDPEPPTGEALAAERAWLRAGGLAWIVVHRARCRTPAPAIQLLDRLLGPGTHHADGDVSWAL